MGEIIVPFNRLACDFCCSFVRKLQFIGMELCEHGDAEVFIKAQENRVLPTEQAIGFLFQMAFALYAGRAELSLRHFDVKLLNFFVGDASRLLAERDGFIGGRSGEGVTLRYGLGEEIVELCLPEDRAQVVRGWTLFDLVSSFYLLSTEYNDRSVCALCASTSLLPR